VRIYLQGSVKKQSPLFLI